MREYTASVQFATKETKIELAMNGKEYPPPPAHQQQVVGLPVMNLGERSEVKCQKSPPEYTKGICEHAVFSSLL